MPENKIKLESRYKEVETYYHPIDEFSGVISTNSYYTRNILSEDSSHLKAIDFDGGPMLSVGDPFEGKKIKSIKSSYFIELE